MKYLAAILAFLTLVSTSHSAPLSIPSVDAYNVRVGTETFAAQYKFTTNTALVETAEAITNMGSDIIKFYMGSDTSYQSGVTLAGNVTNLIELARDNPSYHQVLDMPFRHMIMWAYPFANADEWWGSGYNAAHGTNDYREMYDLTCYLLTNYNNSGKTFYLGHWEGDGYLSVVVNGVAWATNPAPETIQGMIGWLNNRQQAVDDAKKATPHTNVFVYNYAEANRVRDAMENGTNNNERVINMVVPYVTNLDYLSYSSYDAMNLSQADLYTTLNYMQAHLPTTKAAVVPGERIWIGEYGWGGDTPAAQEPLTRAYIQRLLGWEGSGGALPYILFWEMYDNQTTGGTNYDLIDNTDTKVPCYYLHQRFLNEARLLVAQFNETNGALPNDAQFSALAEPMLNAPLPAPVNLAVSNLNQTFLTGTSALLAGSMAQGVYGDDQASVWVFWGTQNGGVNPAAWQNSLFLGVNTNFNPAFYSVLVSNLAPNTNYYFSFYASNASARAWPPAPSEFSTALLNPSDYSNRARITFNGYTHPTALANFPVLVRLGTEIPGFSYSQFASSSGGDLRFTDASGLAQLPYEIDAWQPGGVSSVWVQAPLLSGSSNFIWAYWGNPAATNPPASATNGAVWTAYDLVWHLQNYGFPYYDSAAHYPGVSGNAPDLAGSFIDYFASFNGVSSYINAGPVNLGSAFTLSAWVYLNASATNIQTIWANKQGGWNSAGQTLYINTYNTADGRVILETGDGVNGSNAETSSNAVTPGHWHLVSAAVDEANGAGAIYVDGVNQTASSGIVTDFPNQSGLNLGRFTNSAYYFNGWMDEARVRSGLAGADEIWAQWFNVSSNADFAAISPVNPQPALSIVSNNGAPALSWPWNAGVFTVYSTTNLSAPAWAPVTNPAPGLSDGTWQLPLPTNSAGPIFFRLQAR